MSQATVVGRTRQDPESTSLSLLDVLHNSLVLANIIPHLGASGIVNLAAADHACRALLYNTPGIFRHLDLTCVKKAQLDIDQLPYSRGAWDHAELGEEQSEDDFYSGPLRTIFSTLQQRNFLQHVQTLVLDGLSVTSELCHDIINDAAYNVRILSIRDVKNLNQAKLRGALQYACRTTRPDNSPKLRALYVFGSRDPPLLAPMKTAHDTGLHGPSVGADWNQKSQMALMSSTRHKGDAWWSQKGRIIPRPVSDDWANCLMACEGIIAFDAILCQGPRHRSSQAYGKMSLSGDGGSSVATVALSGCEGCGIAPEGLTDAGSSYPASLPLLAPPPILSSSVRAATSPQPPHQPFAARCRDCLSERYCSACNKWWCEACYKLPGQSQADISSIIVVDDDDDSLPALESLELVQAALKTKSHISKSCWECGNNCDSCIHRTQRVCRKCCGGYCIIHNEGSSASHGAFPEVVDSGGYDGAGNKLIAIFASATMLHRESTRPPGRISGIQSLALRLDMACDVGDD